MIKQLYWALLTAMINHIKFFFFHLACRLEVFSAQFPFLIRNQIELQFVCAGRRAFHLRFSTFQLAHESVPTLRGNNRPSEVLIKCFYFNFTAQRCTVSCGGHVLFALFEVPPQTAFVIHQPPATNQTASPSPPPPRPTKTTIRSRIMPF